MLFIREMSTAYRQRRQKGKYWTDTLNKACPAIYVKQWILRQKVLVAIKSSNY